MTFYELTLAGSQEPSQNNILTKQKKMNETGKERSKQESIMRLDAILKNAATWRKSNARLCVIRRS